jgi:hypothetical protein
MGRPGNTVPKLEKLYVEKTDGCWKWSGALGRGGYSKTVLTGRHISGHRAFYEYYIGAIPVGLQIDHLCRNRICVNPSHLEAVTAKENTRRGMSPSSENAKKTHCKWGHPFSGDNLMLERDGRKRTCKKCNAIRTKKYLEGVRCANRA